MFCTKCGANINDDSAFCMKCGQPVNKPNVKQVKKKAASKSELIILGIIGISIILLIGTIIKLVKKNDSNASTDIGIFASSNSDQGDDTIDFTKIVSQCPSCEEPLNLLVELCDLSTEFGYDEDGIKYVSSLKCDAMKHYCTADVIQVVNLPYVYRGYYGAYTGAWQGAGPTGYGTFVGKERFRDFILSYTGDWAYGLPNGQGELYVENFLNTGNTITYSGNMTDGMRDGPGYMQEKIPNLGYLVYGDTYFSYDNLAQETVATLFDMDTGEECEYFDYVSDGNGSVTIVEHWKKGEIRPSQMQQYEIAAGVLFAGFIAYNYSKSQNQLADYKNQLKSEVMADAQRNDAQREADYKKRLQEAEEQAKTRKWNEDKYYDALKNDPNEYYLDTKNYKYQAGFGW